MLKRYLQLVGLSLFFVTCLANQALAEQSNTMDDTILDLFQRHNEKYLCLSSDSSLPIIRQSITDYIKSNGGNIPASADDTAIAAYTLYACPFTPYREELRLANAKDITGVWLYPENSQKLRFGPHSPMWEQTKQMPIKCESVAYYDGGEARNAQITGRLSCPFSTAKDMDMSRKNPNIVQWKMLSDGKLKITRTDLLNHIEEWEVFIVTMPFEAASIQFNQGDLVAYLRKENGNDFNVATVFRHLKRLP
jgi:hypothetical protein